MSWVADVAYYSSLWEGVFQGSAFTLGRFWRHIIPGVLESGKTMDIVLVIVYTQIKALLTTHPAKSPETLPLLYFCVRKSWHSYKCYMENSTASHELISEAAPRNEL